MSPERSRSDPVIVSLAGELDLSGRENVERRLDEAFDAGRSIVVDLGDCTFLDGEILRLLVEAKHRAGDRGLGFVAVLPFSASTPVRRMLLEVLPEEADFPIASTVSAALAALAGSHDRRGAVERWRLQAIRASLWENAARLEELRSERSALLMQRRLGREARLRAKGG